MDLYLHCGETINNENSNLEYVIDQLEVRRIGHGVQLSQKPELIEKVKQKQICIEINPISNQLLNYTKNIQHNQGNLLTKMGVDISISTDDPTMFQNSLLDDYFMVLVSWGLRLN